MPQANVVKFRYEPLSDDLYIDSFRSMFYTERLIDVTDTLQYLCSAFDVAAEVEGEVKFIDTDGEPPELRDLRYHDPGYRADFGDPFPGRSVKLWP